jgi:hypothetical protein
MSTVACVIDSLHNERYVMNMQNLWRFGFFFFFFFYFRSFCFTVLVVFVTWFDYVFFSLRLPDSLRNALCVCVCACVYVYECNASEHYQHVWWRNHVCCMSFDLDFFFFFFRLPNPLRDALCVCDWMQRK